MNDNRNYDYFAYPDEKRTEYNIIAKWVTPNANIVDLGCGNGTLIQLLQKEKSCNCQGVELTTSGVETCKNKGLRVQQGRIDDILPFEDNTFDIAICNVTIQMVLYPEILFREMKRIAKYQIVSFPNFAYFKNRIDLFVNGRMPRQLLFGYEWYNTGHIHQLSLKDFYQLVKETGNLRVIHQAGVPIGYALLDWMGKRMPNLFQKMVIVETMK